MGHARTAGRKMRDGACYVKELRRILQPRAEGPLMIAADTQGGIEAVPGIVPAAHEEARVVEHHLPVAQEKAGTLGPLDPLAPVGIVDPDITMNDVHRRRACHRAHGQGYGTPPRTNRPR
jgi:hypothetical protein